MSNVEPQSAPLVDDSRLGGAGMLALAGLAAMLVAQMTRRQFLDPDVYHTMALVRLALQQGSMPVREVFAYTPTINPTVHHEWGTGLVLYAVVKSCGAAGLIALKYALVFLTALLCLACTRRRGGSWPAVFFMAPLAMVMSVIALSTVRAQMFSFLFLSLLLLLLDLDRSGRRWWIAPWLLVYTAWVNLHGGFLVGIAFVGAYWVEQVVRTRKLHGHLLIVVAAMIGLTLVNPYGWYHPYFVWRAIMLDRPRSDEWAALWAAADAAVLLPLMLLSLLMVAYAGYRRGWRNLPGLLIVLCCGAAVVMHKRHLPIYAIAWFCYVPAWLDLTQLGEFFRQIWERRKRVVASVFALVGASLLALERQAPWHLVIPVTPDDERLFDVAYPVGAVNYLRDQKFKGNVMTPYVVGAYHSWYLHPAVLVGMDGRHDAAFQPGVVEGLMDMYRGKPDWKRTLGLYPTDLLLVSRSQPLDKLMTEETDWPRVYRDDAFDIFARPGLAMPMTYRSGQPLIGQMP